MFVAIYLECLYGLSVINSNEVNFQYYAFLKAQSYMWADMNAKAKARDFISH